MEDISYMFKPIVLVTGFGPFLNHPVNASWEAVKLMNKDEIESKHNVELVQLELPVTYENVDEFVPALWETHEPKVWSDWKTKTKKKASLINRDIRGTGGGPGRGKPLSRLEERVLRVIGITAITGTQAIEEAGFLLVIHVGVSNIAKCMTIEQQAHKKGYQRMDYFDKCPANHVCSAGSALRICTKLDVQDICDKFNDGNPIPDTSADLSLDAGRYLCEYIYYTSLSVDNSRTLFVHVPDLNVYSSEQTARALERILDLCWRQIKEMDIVTDKLKTTKLDAKE